MKRSKKEEESKKEGKQETKKKWERNKSEHSMFREWCNLNIATRHSPDQTEHEQLGTQGKPKLFLFSEVTGYRVGALRSASGAINDKTKGKKGGGARHL